MKNLLYKRISCVVMVATCLSMIMFSGCSSTSGRGSRFERYRPDVSDFSIPIRSSNTKVGVRILRTGDKVRISLRGIPNPQLPMDEVIDDRGYVTLALIGKIKIAELSLSEAKKSIEDAYVDQGYYKRVEVSIFRTQEGEFFVHGEVMLPGMKVMTGKLSLMQAISTAGGFTMFAKESKIEVKRNEKLLKYDGKDIKKGKMPDPVIQSGDIIYVNKRRW